MFNSDQEYLNATKHARINTYREEKPRKYKLLIVSLLIAVVLGYIGFMYLKSETDFLSYKQAVLGVSVTVENRDLSDEEFIKILKVTEFDFAEDNKKEISLEELTNSMQILMNEPSIQSQSSYTEAISRELDDKSGFKGRVVVVKKGDTLSSLAEKFYGNSMEFSKIIQSNSTLTDGSFLLKIGQTINIPY